MDFDLTKEQQMVRSMVREFAETEIRPMAAERDETGMFPWEIIKKAGTLNLMAKEKAAGLYDEGYMVKPIKLEELRSKIDSTLSRSA